MTFTQARYTVEVVIGKASFLKHALTTCKIVRTHTMMAKIHNEVPRTDNALLETKRAQLRRQVDKCNQTIKS